jgi:pimeloyl-ACP methyl ester carboxylesterase
MIHHSPVPRALAAAGAAAIVATGVALAMPAPAAQPSDAKPATHGPKPTIVLVHGAFADSSGFNSVVTRLTHDGYPVRTVSNPLRGLLTDTAAAKDVLRDVKGPIVLVGHSYGGAVITNAGAGDPEVKALVYLAALAPDKGEEIFGPPDVPIKHPLPPLPLVDEPTVAADGTPGSDAYLDPAKFRETFANDIDPTSAAAMAITQRPIDKRILTDKTTVAAWRTIPSWYLITRDDHANPPELQQFFAKRAKSHVEDVNSSHAVYVSHPGAVVRIIEDAAHATN